CHPAGIECNPNSNNTISSCILISNYPYCYCSQLFGYNKKIKNGYFFFIACRF
ncbi:hypothetical protein C1646_682044, partial [Rhizophagus diaphanus]